MTWKIEFAASAVKQLKKLDPSVARRLTALLRERVAPATDVRSLGEALKGAKLGEFWKYRVGDDRIIAQSIDQQVRVLVVRIGHRREIYR